MSSVAVGEVYNVSRMRTPVGQRDGIENIAPNTERGRAPTRRSRDSTTSGSTSGSASTATWSQIPDEDGGPPNVNRLKSRFQTSTSNDPNLDSIRTAEIQPTNTGRFAAVKGSPDIKRKRSNESLGGGGGGGDAQKKLQRPAGAVKSSGGGGGGSGGGGGAEGGGGEGEAYFESTNHVQRFQHTRAIFAKMEEQSRQEKERQRQMNQRRAASPARHRTVSPPPPLRSPISNENRRGVVTAPLTSSSSSAPPIGRSREKTASTSSTSSTASGSAPQGQENAPWDNRYQRLGSAENLNERGRLDKDPKEAIKGDARGGASLSRSETDLSNRDRSDSDVVLEKVPAPKWLMKHYEKEVLKKSEVPQPRAGSAPFKSASTSNVPQYMRSQPPPTSPPPRLSSTSSSSSAAATTTAAAVGSPPSSSSSSSHRRSRASAAAVVAARRQASQSPTTESASPVDLSSRSEASDDSKHRATGADAAKHSRSTESNNALLASDAPAVGAAGVAAAAAPVSGTQSSSTDAGVGVGAGVSFPAATRAARPNSLRQQDSDDVIFNHSTSTSSSRYERPRSFSSDSRDDDDDATAATVRWRNRYSRNRDPAAAAAGNRNSLPASGVGGYSGAGGSMASGAVLLPKRRSRDENGFSTEELEASLQEADNYWGKGGGLGLGLGAGAGGMSGHVGTTSEAVDARMTESTYSSGSGEEMARSESGHDLGESPISPAEEKTSSRKAWASKYSLQKGGGSAATTTSGSGASAEVPTTAAAAPAPATTTTSSYTAGGGGGYSGSIYAAGGGYAGGYSSGGSGALPSYRYQSVPEEPASRHSDITSRFNNYGEPDIPATDDLDPGDAKVIADPPSYDVSTSGGAISGRLPAVAAVERGHVAMETESALSDDTEVVLDEREASYVPMEDPRLRGNQGSMLAPPLGVKKVTSPDESVSSMTPSEQDNLLSKSEEVCEDLDDSGEALILDELPTKTDDDVIAEGAVQLSETPGSPGGDEGQ